MSEIQERPLTLGEAKSTLIDLSSKCEEASVEELREIVAKALRIMADRIPDGDDFAV